VEFQLAHMAVAAHDQGRTLMIAQMARYQFGWQQRAAGYDADGMMVAADKIGEMSQFLCELRRTDHESYQDSKRAEDYALFMAGPEAVMITQRKRVTALLNYVDANWPGASRFLDQDRMKEWDAYGYVTHIDAIAASFDDGGLVGRGNGFTPESEKQQEGIFNPGLIWALILCLFAISRLGSCDATKPEPVVHESPEEAAKRYAEERYGDQPSQDRPDTVSSTQSDLSGEEQRRKAADEWMQRPETQELLKKMNESEARRLNKPIPPQEPMATDDLTPPPPE
jgi:hypothetical protein